MLLARAFSPRAAVTGWAQVDDRWYLPNLGLTGETSAGIRVGPETVFNCGIVLAALRFKAEAVAMCPHETFRRRERGGGWLLDPEHPSHIVLANPNPWQTEFEWNRLMVLWFNLYGNAYSHILWEGSTPLELRPLHPEYMRVLKQSPDGIMRYEWKPPGKVAEILTGDEVLHYSGLSLDGQSGLVTYQLIRNAVGVALAAEQYTGTFLRKGTRLSGVLAVPPGLSKDQRAEIGEEWDAHRAGSSKVGSVAVLPTTVTFTPISSTNRDSQFVELQDKQVESILMALGVPGVVVGYAGDKANTYASTTAFFENADKNCIGPMIENMNQRDCMALFARGSGYKTARNMDKLQKPNIRDRYAAYYQAVGGPWLTRNEVRAEDEWNAITDDPTMDEVLRPANMPAPSTPKPEPQPFGGAATEPEDEPAEPTDDDEKALALVARLAERATEEAETAWSVARRVAYRAALGVVQREVHEVCGRQDTARPMLGAAARYAKNPEAWHSWLCDFYGKHAGTVAKLGILEHEAVRYAEEQRQALLTHGPQVAATWEETVPDRLVALMLGHAELAA